MQFFVPTVTSHHHCLNGPSSVLPETEVTVSTAAFALIFHTDLAKKGKYEHRHGNTYVYPLNNERELWIKHMIGHEHSFCFQKEVTET